MGIQNGKGTLAIGSILGVVVVALVSAQGRAWAGLAFDSTGEKITADGGTLDFDNEHLMTTGPVTAERLTLTSLNCTGKANGGALTANASGVVSCSDDDGGGGGSDPVLEEEA